MYSHCQESDTPISVSEDDFLALASSVTTTSSSATSTAKPTSTGTQTSTTSTGTSTSTPASHNNNDEQGGLSTGARAGIVAGASVAGVVLLLAAIWLFMRHRKRSRQYEEVHLMNASKPPSSHMTTAASPSMHHGHISTAPSELEGTESTVGSPSFRQTWQSSWTGSQGPWSPNDLGPPNNNPPVGNIYETHSTPIYEMSAENEVPTAVSPMPTISVSSPPISPTSHYTTEAGWDNEPPAERSRYEPYRPT